MRLLSALLLVLLVSLPSSLRARELVVLDFIGYGWETASFPPSEAGDVLSIPLIVDNLSASLGIDLGEEELTGYMSGLTSAGAVEIAPGLWRIEYTGGTLSFHRDPSKDHEFGVSPPNATVPSSFTNGTLCLGGTLQNFTFFYHEPSGSGSMEADVQFTDGACIDALAGMNPSGFTFGGFLTRQSSGTVIEGYDLQLDGFLEANANDGGECEFDCFALTEASFEVPEVDDDDDDKDKDKDKDDDDADKDDDRNDGDDDDDDDGDKNDKSWKCPKHTRDLDEKFEVEGSFATCQAGGEVDPGAVEVTIRIGDYLQTLPVGSLEPNHKQDEWKYKLKHACGELSSLKLERDKDGSWEFKLKGKGIATTLLLPEDKQLQVQLTLGSMSGQATVELRSKRDKCIYKSDDDDACEPQDEEEPDDSDLVRGPQTLLRTDLTLQASPNPFQAGTILFLNAVRSASATVEIYDLRGRVVRVLHQGSVRPGQQQWTWDGADAQGVPVASGVYFYRVSTPQSSTVHKLIRMK